MINDDVVADRGLAGKTGRFPEQIELDDVWFCARRHNQGVVVDLRVRRGTIEGDDAVAFVAAHVVANDGAIVIAPRRLGAGVVADVRQPTAIIVTVVVLNDCAFRVVVAVEGGPFQFAIGGVRHFVALDDGVFTPENVDSVAVIARHGVANDVPFNQCIERSPQAASKRAGLSLATASNPIPPVHFDAMPAPSVPFTYWISSPETWIWRSAAHRHRW